LSLRPPPPRRTTHPLHDALPIFAIEPDEHDAAEMRLDLDKLLRHDRDCTRPRSRASPEPGSGLPQNVESALDFQAIPADTAGMRSEEHTSELQSRGHLVCRLLRE